MHDFNNPTSYIILPLSMSDVRKSHVIYNVCLMLMFMSSSPQHIDYI